ncbi:MAG: hypothetical protein ACXW4B_11695 [Micavibrio sp.]
MAMLDYFGPTREDMRAAFNTAAAEGNKYLLMLSKSMNDEMVLTVHDFTRPVADQSDIVPLLKKMNEECYSWEELRLTGIFDLSKNFDAQIGRPYADGLKETLTPQVKNELSSYDRAVQLQRAQKEWDRKPWLVRLFSHRP